MSQAVVSVICVQYISMLYTGWNCRPNVHIGLYTGLSGTQVARWTSGQKCQAVNGVYHVQIITAASLFDDRPVGLYVTDWELVCQIDRHLRLDATSACAAGRLPSSAGGARRPSWMSALCISTSWMASAAALLELYCALLNMVRAGVAVSDGWLLLLLQTSWKMVVERRFVMTVTSFGMLQYSPIMCSCWVVTLLLCWGRGGDCESHVCNSSSPMLDVHSGNRLPFRRLLHKQINVRS